MFQINRRYKVYIWKKSYDYCLHEYESLVNHLRGQDSELRPKGGEHIKCTCHRENHRHHVNSMNLHGVLCYQLQRFNVGEGETESVWLYLSRRVLATSLLFLFVFATAAYWHAAAAKVQVAVQSAILLPVTMEAPRAGLGGFIFTGP